MNKLTSVYLRALAQTMLERREKQLDEAKAMQEAHTFYYNDSPVNRAEHHRAIKDYAEHAAIITRDILALKSYIGDHGQIKPS